MEKAERTFQEFKKGRYRQRLTELEERRGDCGAAAWKEEKTFRQWKMQYALLISEAKNEIGEGPIYKLVLHMRNLLV